VESKHQKAKKHDTTKIGAKKEITKRFDTGHEMWFGYKESGELKGYVTLKPLFPGYKHCELYWLAVKKKYQGRGIGKKLVGFVEKLAKKMGFRKVCLYTGKNMVNTRAFYEKLDYKKINEFPGYYGFVTGNTTAVLYAKEM
jgi:ribosomal protein S18 acetylase RimI-like enzyme